MADQTAPIEREGAPRAAVRNGRPARSPGVHAALSVMELIVSEGHLALGDLARELQLPKSTLHRICAILVERGWALRDEGGRYEPGVRAIGIGSRAAELPIVTGFRHAVAGLMTRHDETVCLAVVDGDESVFVAIEETTQPVRLQTWVGRRAPVFASASGRVLLAGRSPEAVAAEFGGAPPGGPAGPPPRAGGERTGAPRRSLARGGRRRVRRSRARDADGPPPADGERAAGDPRARARRGLRREPRGDRGGAVHRLRPDPQRARYGARSHDDVRAH